MVKASESKPPNQKEQLAAGIATSADGIPIRFDVHGTGVPALVFIHGACCKRSQWSNQIDYFARRRTVVTIDLAGHGESGTGRKKWTMANFGEDVAAVVRKLNLTQVVLVGHSMGGAVVLEAALRVPERLVGLVGVDTLQALERSLTDEQVEQLVAPLRADFVKAAKDLVRERFAPESNPAVVQTVLDDVSSMRPDVGIGEIKELFSDDEGRRQALRQISAPVVVIARDAKPPRYPWQPKAVPFDAEAARRFGVEVKFISGTGHWIMMEKPKAFNRLLEAVVEGFSRR